MKLETKINGELCLFLVKRLLTKGMTVFFKLIVNIVPTGSHSAQSETILNFIQKFIGMKSNQNIFEKKKANAEDSNCLISRLTMKQ